ncbi:MAG: MgtC/SapB family protein [Chloroflexota bacterium]|nr:MgtC/SapB family protein [Chloroflexota bacterium]
MISFPDIVLRLCVALLLGACIGAERQSHAQTAGLRTNALVSLGTCLFMIISAYSFEPFLTIAHVQIDPSRVASYVVAGIGFLGAGTIFRSQSGDRVKGLTTAAAIWVVAAIGLACGIGFLWEAVVTTALTLGILILLRVVERFFWHPKSSSVQHIHIEASTVNGQLIGDIYNTCSRARVLISKLGVHTEKTGAMIELACHIHDPTVLGRTIGELQTLAGIQAVHADIQTGSHARELSEHLDEEPL